MLVNNPDALKEWLIAFLDLLSDADPVCLARYILALLKKDKSIEDLKQYMNEQLNIFLNIQTDPFLEHLFDVIASEEYLRAATDNNGTATTSVSSEQIQSSQDELNANIEQIEHLSRQLPVKKATAEPHETDSNNVNSSPLSMSIAKVRDVSPISPVKSDNEVLGVGVAVVNRLLYAIGGFDGNERLSTMECYHPENNEWTILPPMKTGRSGAGVAALNQYIYVVGGFDGTRQLSSVERYDTENEVWDTVDSIKIARSALSLTVLDGKLYAMGGFDGHTFLAIVEVYDPIHNKWEEGTPLTSGRSGHASAVIYQPSCANTYMECMEEQMNRSKKPPNADEDDKKRPSTSKNAAPSSSSSSALHAFSGNRCNHCDEPNRAPDHCEEEQRNLSQLLLKLNANMKWNAKKRFAYCFEWTAKKLVEVGRKMRIAICQCPCGNID